MNVAYNMDCMEYMKTVPDKYFDLAVVDPPSVSGESGVEEEGVGMRTKGHKCYNIKCGACVGKTLCGLSGDEALTCVDREAASDVIMQPMTDTSDEPSQIQKLATRYERNMHKPWKKPMTNADRIRAMNDEELAEWLSICGCPDAFSTVGDCENGKCEECWSTWLQQPVKEDA